MVCSEGCLESVDGLNAPGQEYPGVVDQNVEFLVSALEIVGQFAD